MLTTMRLLVFRIVAVTCLFATSQADIVWISSTEQQERTLNASIACFKQMIDSNRTTPDGVYCPVSWDSLSCWPDTHAGTYAIMPCPDYINKFKTEENATKYCTENGTWFVNPISNEVWTDYTKCMTVFKDTGPLMLANMVRISLMYNIGYGISLLSLVLAVIIMSTFKRLYCARNTVHMNLFLSFILRAVFSFLKENLLVHGLGFEADVRHHRSGVEFVTERQHWECKLFFSLYNYTLGANYMWIFVEALYLHMLLSVAMFSERSGIKWYIVFGWATPAAFVLSWSVVRFFLEDELCWNTHPTPAYFWIIQGPIVLSTLINFGCFLNVIRILFTKLNATHSPEAKKFRYRRLAKSTLVLIPLFGIHYIVFMGLPDKLVDEKSQLIKLYFEMFFNSIQGFVVALLFCFLNGEVQSEIRKQWYRFRLIRSTNFIYSRSVGNHTFTSYASHESNESPKPIRASSSNKENIALDGLILNNSCDVGDVQLTYDTARPTSLINGHL